MESFDNFHHLITHLYLTREESHELGLELLESGYFQDNQTNILKIKGLLECLEDPLIFTKLFRSTQIGKTAKQRFQALIYHIKNIILDELPDSLSERQKFESWYSEALRCNFKSISRYKRFNELCLIKMKRCLEKGQISRFKKISSQMVQSKIGPSYQMAEGGRDLKLFLDRIQKIHDGSQNIAKKSKTEKTKSAMNFDTYEADWNFATYIAANLDSANNVVILEVFPAFIFKITV